MVAVDSSVGTVEEKKSVDIKFTPTLTYAERLMLKKHRRTELSESSTPLLDDESRSLASSKLSGSVYDQSSSSGLFTEEKDNGETSKGSINFACLAFVLN